MSVYTLFKVIVLDYLFGVVNDRREVNLSNEIMQLVKALSNTHCIQQICATSVTCYLSEWKVQILMQIAQYYMRVGSQAAHLIQAC